MDEKAFRVVARQRSKADEPWITGLSTLGEAERRAARLNDREKRIAWRTHTPIATRVTFIAEAYVAQAGEPRIVKPATYS